MSESMSVTDSCASALECMVCILCDTSCTDSIENITDDKWRSIQEKALQWRTFDKFGQAHTNVEGKTGPSGLYMHKACYISLSSKLLLGQAEKRKNAFE